MQHRAVEDYQCTHSGCRWVFRAKNEKRDVLVLLCDACATTAKKSREFVEIFGGGELYGSTVHDCAGVRVLLSGRATGAA